MDYPVWDVEDVMFDVEEEALPEVESYSYDYAERETFVTGSGKTMRCDAKDAYIFWVVKCVATERYECEAYSTDFGVEFLAIMRNSYPRSIAESEIRRSIKEALHIDNRTVNVSNFRFNWQADMCHITFEVESVYGIDTVTVERGGYSSGRIN